MTTYRTELQTSQREFDWLIDHLDGWQFGEQGLLLAMAERLDLKGIAIEYGAGDGESLPLTIDRYLASGRGKGLLVEIDERKRDNLKRLYHSAECVESLDWTQAPSPAIVVIDIDGEDSAVMVDMLNANVRPALLVVEHMDREYPIDHDDGNPLPRWALGLELQGGFRLQDTTARIASFALGRGYFRIGINRCNSFFVRHDYYQPLLK